MTEQMDHLEAPELLKHLTPTFGFKPLIHSLNKYFLNISYVLIPGDTAVGVGRQEKYPCLFGDRQ